MASRRSEGYLTMKTSGLYFIDVKTCEGGCKRVLNKKDVLEILWRKLLMTASEEMFSGIRESGSSNE